MKTRAVTLLAEPEGGKWGEMLAQSQAESESAGPGIEANGSAATAPLEPWCLVCQAPPPLLRQKTGALSGPTRSEEGPSAPMRDSHCHHRTVFTSFCTSTLCLQRVPPPPAAVTLPSSSVSASLSSSVLIFKHGRLSGASVLCLSLTAVISLDFSDYDIQHSICGAQISPRWTATIQQPSSQTSSITDSLHRPKITLHQQQPEHLTVRGRPPTGFSQKKRGQLGHHYGRFGSKWAAPPEPARLRAPSTPSAEYLLFPSFSPRCARRSLSNQPGCHQRGCLLPLAIGAPRLFTSATTTAARHRLVFAHSFHASAGRDTGKFAPDSELRCMWGRPSPCTANPQTASSKSNDNWIGKPERISRRISPEFRLPGVQLQS